MLDLFHIAKPQGCDIQTFYGSGNLATSQLSYKTWSKPRGVSNIYMLLIGAGGNGNGTQGGGSGAVTVWFGSAQNVPDNLFVNPALDNSSASLVRAYVSTGLLTLLSANSASGLSAGTAMTANQFCASGFFQSTAGQAGSSGDPGASTTTFLGGGGGASVITGNYGYSILNRSGLFFTQPILVGVGASGVGSGGIGCGGGASSGVGGQGMVLIASW